VIDVVAGCFQAGGIREPGDTDLAKRAVHAVGVMADDSAVIVD
jgi:hypothetical protein